MTEFTERDRRNVNEAAQELGEMLIQASAELAPGIARKWHLSDWQANLATANAFLRVAHPMTADVYELDEADLASRIDKAIKDALRGT